MNQRPTEMPLELSFYARNVSRREVRLTVFFISLRLSGGCSGFFAASAYSVESTADASKVKFRFRPVLANGYTIHGHHASTSFRRRRLPGTTRQQSRTIQIRFCAFLATRTCRPLLGSAALPLACRISHVASGRAHLLRHVRAGGAKAPGGDR